MNVLVTRNQIVISGDDGVVILSPEDVTNLVRILEDAQPALFGVDEPAHYLV